MKKVFRILLFVILAALCITAAGFRFFYQKIRILFQIGLFHACILSAIL